MPIPLGTVASARVPGVAFTPTDIAGLVLWFDADDAATFTFGTGDNVAQWNDKSGNGYHVAQGTGGNQPNRSGTQNGRSTVQFASTDRLVRNISGAMAAGTGYTILATFRRTGSNSFEAHPMTITASSQAHPIDYWGSNLFVRNNVGGFNNYTAQDIAAVTSWAVLTTRIEQVGADVAIAQWKDGSSTLSTTWSGNTHGRDIIYLSLGSRQDEATQLTGDVAEIIMYDSPLSTGDRGDVEDYLSAKWATP